MAKAHKVELSKKIPVQPTIDIINKLAKEFLVCKRGGECTQKEEECISFQRILEETIIYTLKGCRCKSHRIAQLCAITIYIRKIFVYLKMLPIEKQAAFKKELKQAYSMVHKQIKLTLGDIKGDFQKNLMDNVFRASKEKKREASKNENIAREVDQVGGWPLRLFEKSIHRDTPVQKMAYSELLRKFEIAANRGSGEAQNGESAETWSIIRELYKRTMERVRNTPTSQKEVVFILQIDKVCRDYSPLLQVTGGIVGSLRINRKKYMEKAVCEMSEQSEKYSVSKILRAAKRYKYPELIKSIIERLATKGAQSKDLKSFKDLIEIELEEVEAEQQAQKEKSEALSAELEKICNEVQCEIAKAQSNQREIKILRKEIEMIDRIVQEQEVACLYKTHSISQREKISLIVGECEKTWNRIVGKAKGGKHTEKSEELDLKTNKSKTSEANLKQRENLEEISYFSALYNDKMKKAREAMSAQEKEKKKEQAEQSAESQRAASADVLAESSSKSSNSPRSILAYKVSGVLGTPRSVVSVGQSPKEQICSDIRCQEHTVSREDSHLLKTYTKIDESAEEAKRPQRLAEIREYFGGLRYASFYSRNFPDALRHLLKSSPAIYQRVKTLYDTEFTKLLKVGHISVCRRSLFRDAYIEMINARKGSEIVSQLKDDVVMERYMETLKMQTIEKVIVMEKKEKIKKIKDSRKAAEKKYALKIFEKIGEFFDSCFIKKAPLLSIEEELHVWEKQRRAQLENEMEFTKNHSEHVSIGFLNVSKALVDLIKYTPGYVYRKQPDAVNINERYTQWITNEVPVDYEAIKKNPDELRALSMVFNRYIRNFNRGIISKYLYIAMAERAMKVPLDRVDYGLGLLMLPTIGSNSLWLLKHVVYTIEKVAEYEKTNFVSYQNLVNIVSQNLLADDTPYTMDTFAITLELGHSLFAAVRNVSFMQEIENYK